MARAGEIGCEALQTSFTETVLPKKLAKEFKVYATETIPVRSDCLRDHTQISLALKPMVAILASGTTSELWVRSIFVALVLYRAEP